MEHHSSTKLEKKRFFHSYNPKNSVFFSTVYLIKAPKYMDIFVICRVS